MIGPSGIALLRRLPTLWTEQVPATLPTGELARSLGLGGGTGQHNRCRRVLDRLVQFRFAVWLEPDVALGAYTEVTPIARQQLHRLPEWTQKAHERLLNDQVRLIGTEGRATPTRASDVKVRLDRLQQSSPSPERANGLGR